jgi:hypothetical protein
MVFSGMSADDVSMGKAARRAIAVDCNPGVVDRYVRYRTLVAERRRSALFLARIFTEIPSAVCAGERNQSNRTSNLDAGQSDIFLDRLEPIVAGSKDRSWNRIR